MKINTTTTSVFTQPAHAIVLFAFEKERLSGPAGFKPCSAGVTDKEFKGAEKQLLLLHTAGKRGIQAGHVLLAGLGKRKEFDPEKMRRAMGAVVKKLRDAGIDRAAVQVACDEPGCSTDDCIAAVVDSAELVAYKFTKYKSDDDKPVEFKSLTLCLPAKSDLREAKGARGAHADHRRSPPTMRATSPTCRATSCSRRSSPITPGSLPKKTT